VTPLKVLSTEHR